MMYAVVVTFQIELARMAEFMPAMRHNAATSLKGELECHHFDVCTDPDRPGEVVLYELYTDRTAFESHLASAHFKAFDAVAAPMITSKVVHTYSEVTP
ncbi:MAG: putative quinol monooxygenase [Paracoccaceae bacterium]